MIDRRNAAETVRPLGRSKDARFRAEWTMLEVVAWIATSDLDLVSGVSRYQPMPLAVADGLTSGARLAAVRMDVEDGFCCCGGDSEWLKRDNAVRCTCFLKAQGELLDAVRSGRIMGTMAGAAVERHGYSDLMLGREVQPLFPQVDVRRLWPQVRKFRRKEKLTVDVTVEEMIAFTKRAGDVGHRRLLAEAKRHFQDRPVKDRVVREARSYVFPNKRSGRPTLKK